MFKGYALAFLLIFAATASLAQSDLPTGDPLKGKSIFRQKCNMCHSLEPGENKIGASLYDLFGKVGGTAEGYAYSSSMMEVRPLWDAYSMEYWTTNPKSLVPRTTMPFKGLPSQQDRADLIAYLRKATAPEPALTENDMWRNDSLFFDRDIAPILTTYCSGCHGHNNQLTSIATKGVLLTDFNELMIGGIRGPLVVPGHSDKSRLTDFFDGTKHFSTVTDLETRAVKEWIDSLTPYEIERTQQQTNKTPILLTDVDLSRGGNVYCKPSASDAFLQLVIKTPGNDTPAHIDWDRITNDESAIELGGDGKNYAIWKIPQLNGDDKELYVFPTMSHDKSALGSTFLFSESEIPSSLVDEYFKVFSFRQNPLIASNSLRGELIFWLDDNYDVNISISEISQNGSKIVYDETYPDIMGGKNIVPIDFSSFPSGSSFYRKYVISMRVFAIKPGKRDMLMGILVGMEG